MFNGMYVEEVLGHDGDRRHIPLDLGTPYANFRGVGSYGASSEGEWVYPFRAADEPERVAALLRSGRRVYVELLTPVWAGRTESLERALEPFTIVPVWHAHNRPALAELAIRSH